MTAGPLGRDGFTARRSQFFDAASAATGLDDFGPDDYGEGLDLFLQCLDTEAILSDGGMAMSAGMIEMVLAGRLHSQAGWKRRPDALSRPIIAPLIITGIVRSGTTALHKLLSMDKQFQGLEHWLTRTPMPRPPRPQWDSIAAYRNAVAAMNAMIEMAPEFENDHMMSADGVEESIMLLPQCFNNNIFPSQWNIPGYDSWYRRQNETSSYQRFAKNLQLIGADEPARRWLLKNPTDLLAMDAVLNVFPDAMVVQTHRDPLQAVPSVTSLIAAGRRLFEGAQTDPNLVMRRETEFWALALERADAARHRTRKPVFDIEFNDFVHDQLGTVKAIYAYFGLDLTIETEAAMRGWLAQHPRKSTSLHRFTPEDYGMPSHVLLDRYSTYREQHNYG